MKRRAFMKLSGLVASGAMSVPFCQGTPIFYEAEKKKPREELWRISFVVPRRKLNVAWMKTADLKPDCQSLESETQRRKRVGCDEESWYG